MADNGSNESISSKLSMHNNDEQGIKLDLNGISKEHTKNSNDSLDIEGGASSGSTQRGDRNITDKQNDQSNRNSNEGQEDIQNTPHNEVTTSNVELIDDHNKTKSQDNISEQGDTVHQAGRGDTDDVNQNDEVKYSEVDEKSKDLQITEKRLDEITKNQSRDEILNIQESCKNKPEPEVNDENTNRKHEGRLTTPDNEPEINKDQQTNSVSEKGTDNEIDHLNSSDRTSTPPAQTKYESRQNGENNEKEGTEINVKEKEDNYSESFEESETENTEKTKEVSFPSNQSVKFDNTKDKETPASNCIGTLNEKDDISPELTSTPRRQVNDIQQENAQERESPAKDDIENSDTTLTAGSWPSYEEKKEDNLRKSGEDVTPQNLPSNRSQEYIVSNNDVSLHQNNLLSGLKKNKEHSSEEKEEENLEIKQFNQSDDTLDDIEPISSSENNPPDPIDKDLSPQTMDQKTEKPDDFKLEQDKSDVVDDNARADEHPKRDIANDTDHEAEELRTEEVEKTASVSSNSSTIEHSSSHTAPNKLSDPKNVLRSSQSSRIKSPIGSQSSLNTDSKKSNDVVENHEQIQEQHTYENSLEKEKLETEEDEDGQETPKYTGQEHETDKPMEQTEAIASQDKETEDTTESKDQDVSNEERKDTIVHEESEKTPTPEPEPIKITRNITVDHAVDTISELESSVRNLLEDMKELTANYHDRLKAEPISSFVQDLDKFRGDFISMQDAYKKCESLFMFLNKTLKELRVTGDELNTTIDRKLREEDLDTWMEVDGTVEEEKNKIKEEKIAATKSAIAKANDAKTFIAKAAVAVTEASVFAAECEAEAAEASGVAARAWEAAIIARKDAEVAQKAAEEKRLAAAEARKRAEERARKKAEELKKKQAEEDALLAVEARKKGVSFEDEKSRALAEKSRKEAERRNPKNWPRNIYSIDPGDFDPGVGCVIRAIDGCLPREEVEVKRLDQLSGILTLVENEELVSNIIEIQPTDTEKRYIFEEPFALAIPHCAGRGVPGREPIVKTLQQNGKWVELPTRDVLFEDIRELRFVETQTRKFGLFAVVLRLKRDTLTFVRKGNKVSSSVDGRVTFTCPPGMFKTNITFNVEVQPIETSIITDLKVRRSTECEKLLASSPIVRFNIPNRKFSKSLTMTLPLPANPSRSKRPTTAAPTQRDKEDMKEKRALSAQDRPLVTFNNNKEDEIEEDIHLLVKDAYGSWCKLPDVVLIQAKNKDIVTFEIKEPHDRFMVMRTTLNATVPRIEAIAGLLEVSLLHRPVNFFLRQQNSDPNDILVSCSNSNKIDKELRKLSAEGYEEGPAPSRDIILKEGQIIEIRFRGNVNCVSENVSNLKLIYNTHIRSKLDFKVEEVDRFAQKGFECYRGFAQVFTKVLIPKQLTPAERAKVPIKQAEMEEEERLLTELIINLPKPEPEPPRPLRTAPIRITSEGPDPEDVLQYIAGELGDEWKKLAQYLNLKSVRIQAILRQNNANPDPKKIRYDMLITWAKRVPRCVNKLEILSHALLASGRGDLAEELRERDVEFRRRRSANLRDTYLQRAFIKVAQNPTAVKDWRLIAKRLGLTEIELTKIEKSKPSIQEKCYHSLRTWQHNSGEGATLAVLSNFLRRSNYRGLARDIDAIG